MTEVLFKHPRHARRANAACTPLLPLLALSALPACTPADSIGSRAGDRPAGAPQTVSSADGLSWPRRSGPIVFPDQVFGQWRLVALTGVKVAGQRSIHLLIGGGVEAMSQCLRLSYGLDLQGPWTGVPAVPEEVLRDQLLKMEVRPSPACTRGLDPVEKAFSKLLQSPVISEGRSGGRIALVGHGGEALLERPKDVAADLYQHLPWQMWGAWHVESMILGDKAMPKPLKSVRVLFKTGRIQAKASCKAWSLPYQQQGNRLTIRGHAPGGCERDDFPDELAFSEIMAGDVTITQSSPTERLLVGRAGSIRLVRPWLDPSWP